jgi:hypothetical protein
MLPQEIVCLNSKSLKTELDNRVQLNNVRKWRNDYLALLKLTRAPTEEFRPGPGNPCSRLEARR